MTLNAPAGWRVRPQAMEGGTAVLAFTPSSDCYFFGIPNPASANSSPGAAHRTTAQLAPEAWVGAASSVSDFVSGGAPTVVSQSVDTSGFWPVQRAQLRSGSRNIYGVIQVRPGVELRGFCSGPDASYDSILNTMGHPNDQQWQAQAESEPAQAATAEQAQGQSEQPAQPQRRQRRERGITRGETNGAAGGAPM
jgi:hypothetical protein